MEIISAILIAISSFFTGYFVAPTPSVEVGISSLSPAGIDGGYAVPASGCSDLHNNDCAVPVITAETDLVRADTSVEICWNPDNHTSCTLSPNLSGNPNNIDCDDVVITNATVFSISCTDGIPGESTVLVEVVPTIFEI
jgi:hypothetical protein